MSIKADDPFMEMAKGRMPAPTVLGAAPSVVGEGQPMRPDRSYTKLKWLSTLGGIFGLDHFYLRNPYSGTLKALTVGGCLIWWLWDAIQLWTEKDRVLLYGLSAPFDIKTGFGQGTIAAEGSKTSYEQRSDSAWWMFASLFSFAGGDSMVLGNWGQMLRKLTELAVFAMFVVPLFMTWNDGGLEGLLTFGNIFRALIGALIGFIVLSEWMNVAGSTLGDPVGTFTSGIRVSAKQDKVLNFPRAWVENIDLFGPEIQQKIMHDIGYTTISGTEMHKSFEVRFVTPEDKNAENAADDAEAAAEAAAAAANPIRWHWLLSYMVYLFGPLIIVAQVVIKAIKTAFYALFPAAKVAADLQEKAMKAAEAVTEGKIPLGAIPGLGAVSDAVNKASGIAAAVSALPSAPPISNIFEKGTAAAVSALPSAPPAIKSIVNTDPMNANIENNPNPIMHGGARGAEPTGQGMILGASVFALAGGAALKLAVDYLLPSQ
jgi:hypothetical protein